MRESYRYLDNLCYVEADEDKNEIIIISSNKNILDEIEEAVYIMDARKDIE